MAMIYCILAFRNLFILGEIASKPVFQRLHATTHLNTFWCVIASTPIIIFPEKPAHVYQKAFDLSCTTPNNIPVCFRLLPVGHSMPTVTKKVQFSEAILLECIETLKID